MAHYFDFSRPLISGCLSHVQNLQLAQLPQAFYKSVWVWLPSIASDANLQSGPCDQLCLLQTKLICEHVTIAVNYLEKSAGLEAIHCGRLDTENRGGGLFSTSKHLVALRVVVGSWEAQCRRRSTGLSLNLTPSEALLWDDESFRTSKYNTRSFLFNSVQMQITMQCWTYQLQWTKAEFRVKNLVKISAQMGQVGDQLHA